MFCEQCGRELHGTITKCADCGHTASPEQLEAEMDWEEAAAHRALREQQADAGRTKPTTSKPQAARTDDCIRPGDERRLCADCGKPLPASSLSTVCALCAIDRREQAAQKKTAQKKAAQKEATAQKEASFRRMADQPDPGRSVYTMPDYTPKDTPEPRYRQTAAQQTASMEANPLTNILSKFGPDVCRSRASKTIGIFIAGIVGIWIVSVVLVVLNANNGYTSYESGTISLEELESDSSTFFVGDPEEYYNITSAIDSFMSYSQMMEEYALPIICRFSAAVSELVVAEAELEEVEVGIPVTSGMTVIFPINFSFTPPNKDYLEGHRMRIGLMLGNPDFGASYLEVDDQVLWDYTPYFDESGRVNAEGASLLPDAQEGELLMDLPLYDLETFSPPFLIQ